MINCSHPRIPALTTAQMTGVDRIMTEDLGIALRQRTADIGVPEEVYARLDLHVGPIFAREEIVRLS